MSLSRTNLIVWPDTIQSDRSYVGLIGSKDCMIEADQFILIVDDRYTYFAKIEGRPANFSPALSRDDPAAFSAISKKLLGDIKTMALEQHNLLHFNAKLLQRSEQANEEEISEVLSAPALGSQAVLAAHEDVVRFLSLPTMNPDYKLGQIFHTAIPLCLSEHILRHHLLLAGATGQGKTTLITNLVGAASAMGATTFLFDLKPDYQYMELSPHEAHNFRHPSSVPSILLKNISYWNLNVPRPFRPDCSQINVRFSDLDPELYIIKAANSETQYTVWYHLLLNFIEAMRVKSRTQWTLEDFHAWMPKSQADAAKMPDVYPHGSVPHESTLAANYRVTLAKPSWVDIRAAPRGMLQAKPATSAQRVSPFFFESSKFLAPNQVHVIQAEPAIDQDYGLFVTTLLKKISQQKEQRELTHPVVIIIDEAEDIFSGPEFARGAVGTIAGIIRKGRSQNIGVVLSVQSAMSIPARIAQNLNTIVAFRHNDEDAAGHIKKILGRDAANLQNLDPGHVILRFHGAKSGVRASLDREAFQLVGTK